MRVTLGRVMTRCVAKSALPLLAAILLMTMPASASSLHDTVAAGDEAAVARLIAAGTDLERRDGQGRTALLVAVDQNRVAIAKALLQAGASPNAQAANQDTPWLLAGARGRTEIIAAMIPKKPDLSIRNRYGGNALIPACERAHVEAIPLLLQSGIDVNHVNNLGWTCLLECVMLGDGGPRHQEAAKLVLAAGADPNLADRDGVSPRDHAHRRGQNAVASLIEQAGGR